MKISISATNPCHLYPFAQELARHDALGCYYSGYPAWKLTDAEKLPLATHTWRTNIVYRPAEVRPGVGASGAEAAFRLAGPWL
ncbi:MAG: hypothetical protein QM796_02765 [Chthoniobacteraceae bacterium]